MKAERIRIGYVIGQLSQGGAERQLYELVRRLDPRRFQCCVYALSERVTPYGDMIRAAGAELRVLKHKGHFDMARLVKLAHLLRKDRVDILHSFLFLGNGYAWPAKLLAGTPHLVTSARNCKEVGLLRGWINRLAFQTSDAIICNGEAVQSFILRHYGAPMGRTAVIYNGLDLDRFAPFTRGGKVAGQRQDGRLVITVGRLVPQKDLDLFLEAARLVANRKAGIRFLIVGDGPCREPLERYASRIGLDGKVSFLGERADVPQLLQAADVFWLTSAWEGLPNVLLEAMACGKPIVTRDVGACREAVGHGVNGYLVPTRDSERFAEHTLALLANPARASEMGEAARKMVEKRFSVGGMVLATEELYSSVLGFKAGISN